MGFTLIEIIIIILIFFIITAYLISGFSFLAPKTLEKEVEKLGGDLLWIRELANCNLSSYIVTFDTINNQYALYRNSVSANNLITPPYSLKVNLASAPPQIVFTSYGKPSTSFIQSIQLNKANRAKTIIIYPNSGAIKW